MIRHNDYSAASTRHAPKLGVPDRGEGRIRDREARTYNAVQEVRGGGEKRVVGGRKLSVAEAAVLGSMVGRKFRGSGK